MRTRKTILAELSQKHNELKALLAKEGFSATDLPAAETLRDEVAALDTELKAVDAVEAMRTETKAREDFLHTPAGGAVEPEDGKQVKSVVLPAMARCAKATNFKDRPAGFGLPAMSAQEQAYRFGKWFLGALLKSETSIAFCKEQGIPIRRDPDTKSHTEGVNTAGGFLVPEEFEATLIDLREMFGIFRQYAYVSPMKSDTKTVPRRVSGLTAYPMGENQTITESSMVWDRVGLVARKWGVLSKMSSELDEDSVIDIGNTLAGEISYAFANNEDLCGFVGDGTSTYHKITGTCTKLKGLSATIANIAGLVVAAGNAYSEILLSDFNSVKGRLPQYADTARAAWYTHKSFYHNVMERLMLAAGGVTAAEIAAGRREPVFMGYPVHFSQVLPSVEANSQVCALFGDLYLAATFGDRRSTTIALSEHLNFAEDEIAIRGTERFDINNHDVGNASATAGLRKPGPVVGLITAAS